MDLKPGKLYRVIKPFAICDENNCDGITTMGENVVLFFVKSRKVGSNRVSSIYFENVFLDPTGRKAISIKYGVDMRPFEYLEEVDLESQNR